MTVTGDMLIGGVTVRGTGETFRAVDLVCGETLDPP